MQNSTFNFLVRFLLLISTALSAHSAFASPLSSLLTNNYHAEAIDDSFDINASHHLNLPALAYNKDSRSTLYASLKTLLNQNVYHSFVGIEFLTPLNKNLTAITRSTSQAINENALEKQQIIFHYIQALENSLYTQKCCYQSKLQQQNTPS